MGDRIWEILGNFLEHKDIEKAKEEIMEWFEDEHFIRKMQEESEYRDWLHDQMFDNFDEENLPF